MAESILGEAEATMTGDRQRQYGDPVDGMRRVGAAWGALLDRDPIPPETVAAMMATLKIVRESGRDDHHRDNLVDAAAYLRIAELAEDAKPDEPDEEPEQGEAFPAGAWEACKAVTYNGVDLGGWLDRLTVGLDAPAPHPDAVEAAGEAVHAAQAKPEHKTDHTGQHIPVACHGARGGGPIFGVDFGDPSDRDTFLDPDPCSGCGASGPCDCG